MHKFIDGSPQLIHWKYIDKWRENGKWKYRYASDKKKASSGGLLSDIKKAASDVASAISKTTSTISKKVSNTISNVSKSISSSLTKISEIPKKLIDSGKNFVDNTLKKFSKNEIVTNPSTDYKYIAKVYLGNDEWRYFYDEKEYANYLIGKGFIDSLLNLKYVQNKQNASPIVSPETPAIEDKPDINRMVDIGKKITEAIINIGNKEPRNSPEDHTYVAKIFTGDGQYRYFYSEEEYEKYLEGDIEMDVEKSDYEKLVDRVVAVDKKPEEIDYFKNVPKKTTSMSAEEDMNEINENYNASVPATSQNCAYCSMAYDLRRRGYDVEAVEYKSVLTRSDVFSLYGVNPSEVYSKLKDYETPEEIAYAMEQYGDGARGIISFRWSNRTGHSVNWEVINGTAYLIDTQKGFMTPFVDEGWKYVGYSVDTRFIRTDNIEPSEDVLRYVQINDKN